MYNSWVWPENARNDVTRVWNTPYSPVNTFYYIYTVCTCVIVNIVQLKEQSRSRVVVEQPIERPIWCWCSSFFLYYTYRMACHLYDPAETCPLVRQWSGVVVGVSWPNVVFFWRSVWLPTHFFSSSSLFSSLLSLQLVYYRERDSLFF